MRFIALILGCAVACGGSGEGEPDLFGWCCDGICGLDPQEANLFERCECPNGFIRPLEGTHGECLPLP